MRALRFAVVALIVTWSSSARADVISDEEAECRGKSAGDACSVNGTAGTCKDETCGKLDYSQGTPPGHKEVDCLMCRAGAAPEAAEEPEPAPADDGATPAKTAEPDAKPTDAKPEANKDDGKADKKGGCSSGGPVSLGSVGLGVLILLGLARGRRRR